MDTLLRSVDNRYVQAYSISMVPCELKKSPNDDAYIPRVVSMGPRYKNSREELMHMEEIKLRCMLSLLHRTGKDEADANLMKCCKTICGLNEEIRASYVDDIYLQEQELAKIMVVDGCFLLELLITKGFDSELPSCLYPPTTAALQVLQNDDVLSDLILLENQIPISIVHALSKTLFPQFFKEDFEQRANKINSLALCILGYSLPQVQSLDINSPHLLDVVHSFINSNNNNNNNHNDHYAVVLDIDLDDTQTQPVNVMEFKLKHCASRLQAAGVNIQLTRQDSRNISCFGWIRNFFGGVLIWLGNMILKNKKVDMLAKGGVRGLNFEFKFEKGKLEIAPLHITKTTKAKWRNMIAWEHHKMDWKKKSSINSRNQINMISSGSSTCGKFTSAALIFNDLICCADDVKLLKNKNIIVDHMKMSNKELEECMRTMSFGVDHGVVGSGYFKMVDDLNNYSKAVFPIRIWKTLCHLFTYYLEWFTKFMKRDYNFVAAVLAILTVVQTVYTIVAYHHSPK